MRGKRGEGPGRVCMLTAPVLSCTIRTVPAAVPARQMTLETDEVERQFKALTARPRSASIERAVGTLRQIGSSVTALVRRASQVGRRRSLSAPPAVEADGERCAIVTVPVCPWCTDITPFPILRPRPIPLPV